MKPPDTLQPPTKFKENSKKKPKVRTSTNSNCSFYSKIDALLNPAQDLFNTTPKISLFFNQFKDFFENAKGCPDLVTLCNEYDSNPEEFLKTIKSIHPVLPDKSIKNRLIKLIRLNLNSKRLYLPLELNY